MLSDGGLEISLTFSAALAPWLAHTGGLAGRREWVQVRQDGPSPQNAQDNPSPTGQEYPRLRQGKGGQTPSHPD